jgi:hypothetical protein
LRYGYRLHPLQQKMFSATRFIANTARTGNRPNWCEEAWGEPRGTTSLQWGPQAGRDRRPGQDHRAKAPADPSVGRMAWVDSMMDRVARTPADLASADKPEGHVNRSPPVANRDRNWGATASAEAMHRPAPAHRFLPG